MIGISEIPLMMTLALGIPQPLQVGLIGDTRSLIPRTEVILDAGYFRFPLRESSRQFSNWSVQSAIRYFPWDEGFFLQGGLGYRSWNLKVDISNLKMEGQSLASQAELSLRSFYFSGVAGYQWKISESMYFGVDLGAQFSLLHGGDVEIKPDPNDPNPGDLTVDDEKVMNRISGLPIPVFSLIRLTFKL